ncbi:hypothetical protein POPTR_013G036201v4 [Populus trichocarpa]|uniref:Uncharacterized protein n=1 Tax=Populus trichocarpa TaxID=3694 RepID=A0ACC0S119_POPTR|nr:hypothetical protein BDE02_13G033100 [Populus trichocarpa]KAI9383154.1 hypothetical protein POPTR_013G036201v4 [Populus trichocarpa]
MNSIKRQSTKSKRSNGFGNEYIVAVEVLWTPQNENDMLSERELPEDYPLLRPLRVHIRDLCFALEMWNLLCKLGVNLYRTSPRYTECLPGIEQMFLN